MTEFKLDHKALYKKLKGMKQKKKDDMIRPGTGKSYVGARLAQEFCLRSSRPVLIVSNQNVAVRASSFMPLNDALLSVVTRF